MSYIQCSWTRRHHAVKMSALSKLICSFNPAPIHIPVGFGNWQTDSKICVELQNTSNGQGKPLRKYRRIGGYTLPDPDLLWNHDNWQCDIGAKTGQLTSGRIWSVQKQTYMYRVTRFVTKVIMWCCREKGWSFWKITNYIKITNMC